MSDTVCNEGCSYGPAPHDCFYKIGKSIGQSVVHPRERWPATFEEDRDVPGLGVHHACGWQRPTPGQGGQQS